VPVVPHGVRLSLGSAEEPDPARVARLAGLAERLAAEQAALVRALVGGGPAPGGFDPERVRATAAALARKRAGEVARAWPGLAAELGPAFTERLLARARLSTRPARLAATLTGSPRRLVVTVRAPGLGERWLSLPFS
jgi:hypothetical protein